MQPTYATWYTEDLNRKARAAHLWRLTGVALTIGGSAAFWIGVHLWLFGA